MSNYYSALTLCLSFVKMFTNTNDKLFYILFGLFRVYVFPSVVLSSTIEKHDINHFDYDNSYYSDIKSCIPCDTSVHHTLKVLNRSDEINKVSEEKCYPKSIYSLMMSHWEDELDIGVSVLRPFENKNTWCRFQVYWKDQIQVTFLLNQNGSIKSTDSLWSLLPGASKTKFWIVKKVSAENDYSGNYAMYQN